MDENMAQDESTIYRVEHARGTFEMRICNDQGMQVGARDVEDKPVDTSESIERQE